MASLGVMINQLERAKGANNAPNAFFELIQPEKKPGSFTLPYYRYLQPMDEFWDLCKEVGIHPLETDGYENTKGPDELPMDWIKHAERELIRGYMFRVSRGERFTDGVIAGHIEDGTFLKILKRVRELQAE